MDYDVKIMIGRKRYGGERREEGRLTRSQYR
jgi:hypothetical protein